MLSKPCIKGPSANTYLATMLAPVTSLVIYGKELDMGLPATFTDCTAISIQHFLFQLMMATLMSCKLLFLVGCVVFTSISLAFVQMFVVISLRLISNLLCAVIPFMGLLIKAGLGPKQLPVFLSIGPCIAQRLLSVTFTHKVARSPEVMMT